MGFIKKSLTVGDLHIIPLEAGLIGPYSCGIGWDRSEVLQMRGTNVLRDLVGSREFLKLGGVEWWPAIMQTTLKHRRFKMYLMNICDLFKLTSADVAFPRLINPDAYWYKNWFLGERLEKQFSSKIIFQRVAVWRLLHIISCCSRSDISIL